MNNSITNVFRLLLGTFLACLVPSVCIMAVVWFADPGQVFHGRNPDTPYLADQLWQTPATIREHFIRGEDGKVAIVGASLAWKILPEDVRDILGLEGTYNLSSGGNGPEAVLEHLQLLFSVRSPEVVICDIEGDYYFLDEAATMPRKENISFLIRGDIIAKLQYLFNKTAFFYSFNMLTGNYPNQEFSDSPNMESAYQMQRASGRRGFSLFSEPKRREHLLREREVTREAARAAYETILREREAGLAVELEFHAIDNLVSLMRLHPETEFIFYVPPTPSIRDPAWPGQIRYYYHYYYGMKHLVQRTAPLANARVFAFGDKREMVENMANYRDYWHGALGIPRYFLYSVREGLNQIDSRNVDAYLARTYALLVGGDIYFDPENSSAFEGRVNEDAYGKYPYPPSKYARQK